MKKLMALVALLACLLLVPAAVVMSATHGAWIKYDLNPVLSVGPAGSWDDTSVDSGDVVFDGGLYKMWYTGSGSIDGLASIGYATSSDGISWVKDPRNPVLRHGSGTNWDSLGASAPAVLHDPVTGAWKMWYDGFSLFAGGFQIGYATSQDGITWQKYPDNPVFVAADEGWDGVNVLSPNVIYKDNLYHMWYAGRGDRLQIGYASSTDGINWTRSPENPVLQLGGDTEWDNGEIAAPSVLFEDNEFHMWYQGFNRGTQRTYIGHATSLDGVHWNKDMWNPVMGPGPSAWDSFSVYYPSVSRIGGQLRMWYHAEAAPDDPKRIGFAGYDFSVVPTPIPDFPTPTPMEPPTPGPTPTPTPQSGTYGMDINGNARFTNQATVTLNVRAPAGVPEMMLSNQGNFGGAAKEPFLAVKTWNLDTQTDTNPKKVYARLFDANGNILAGLQDSIILDMVAPTGTVAVLNPLAVQAAAGGHTLLFNATDAVSGVGEMRLANTSDLSGVAWEPYVLSKSWSFDANGIVYVQFRDLAGNESATVQGEVAKARAPGLYLPKVSR